MVKQNTMTPGDSGGGGCSLCRSQEADRKEEADDKILLHGNVSNVALPPIWSHFLQLYYFSVTHSGINQQ